MSCVYLLLYSAYQTYLGRQSSLRHISLHTHMYVKKHFERFKNFTPCNQIRHNLSGFGIYLLCKYTIEPIEYIL